jgi:UPF0755 protein
MPTPQDPRREASRGSDGQGGRPRAQRGTTPARQQRSRDDIPRVESEPTRPAPPSPASGSRRAVSSANARPQGAAPQRTGARQHAAADRRAPQAHAQARAKAPAHRLPRAGAGQPRHAAGRHAAAHAAPQGQRRPQQGAHAQQAGPRSQAARPQATRPQQRAASRTAPGSTGVSERTARATRQAQGHLREGGARHASERRGHPGRTAAVVALLVLFVGVAGGFLWARVVAPRLGRTQSTVQVAPGQEVTVTIPDGAGGSTIVQTLMDAGVISDSSAFLKAVQTQNADQKLKSGTYVFVTGSDPTNVVNQLILGPNSGQGTVTVAEGLTLAKTAQQVEASLGISQQDFEDQAKVANYASDYSFLQSAGEETLEGYLYPKTYDISGKDATSDTVIRMMLDQYQSEVLGSVDFAAGEAAIAQRYGGYQMSDYQVMVLASIIEREALTDDDRVKIASVFYNRLSSGMPLQSDATMGYVTGGEVTADDLKQESPYNTYLNAGLPPTPICTPSLASIKAALAPADTTYYYFWITQDEHVFSSTYEEHLQAIASSGSTAPEGNGSTAVSE